MKSIYRNDIQGLRAISAILIVICHIWLEKISGGVDIFFVISGYFMTAVLMKMSSSSLLNIFLDFWKKILSKTFIPVALVVSLTLFFWFVLDLGNRLEIIKHASKSIGFSENLYIIRNNLNYLNSSFLNPFQQFWALSIQFQFYLFLPFIFYFSKFNIKRISFVAILIIIFSFFYGLYETYTDESYAYFHPLTRIWEFFFGVLAYLIVLNKGDKKIILFTTFGIPILILILIINALFVPNLLPYPGFASILPVVVALVVLLDNEKFWGVSFLKLNVFQIISKYTFLIYLVHWPILIIYKAYYGLAKINFINGMVVVLLTVFFVLIVNFLNGLITINNAKKVKFYAIILSIILAFSLTFSLLRNIERERLKLAYDDWYLNNTKDFELIDALKVVEGIGLKHQIKDCSIYGDSSDLKICTHGVQGANKTIYVVGGSHIEQWIPTIIKFANEFKVEIVQITKSGCPLGANFENELYDSSCLEWNEKLLDFLGSRQVNYLITNSTRTYPDESSLKENVPISYVKAWKNIIDKQEHVKIIGIRDNPRFSISPNYCLINNFNNPENCAYKKGSYLQDTDPSQRLADLIISLDWNELFCKGDECLTYESNIPIYRDDDHITSMYAEAIYPRVRNELIKIIE